MTARSSIYIESLPWATRASQQPILGLTLKATPQGVY